MPTGTLPERVAQVVAINGRLYESIAPIRRAALRSAPESPALQEQLARARGWVRAEVERVFAAELAAAARDTAAAVELALSFEAWDQLRATQGLSPTRAAATVNRIVTALLTARANSARGRAPHRLEMGGDRDAARRPPRRRRHRRRVLRARTGRSSRPSASSGARRSCSSPSASRASSPG